MNSMLSRELPQIGTKYLKNICTSTRLLLILTSALTVGILSSCNDTSNKISHEEDQITIDIGSFNGTPGKASRLMSLQYVNQSSSIDFLTSQQQSREDVTKTSVTKTVQVEQSIDEAVTP